MQYNTFENINRYSFLERLQLTFPWWLWSSVCPQEVLPNIISSPENQCFNCGHRSQVTDSAGSPPRRRSWDSWGAAAGSGRAARAPPPRGSWRGRRASRRRWTPPSTARRTPTRRSWTRTGWSSAPEIGYLELAGRGNVESARTHLRRTPLDGELGPAVAGVLVVYNISC